MKPIAGPAPVDMPSWYPYFIHLAPGDDLINALNINKAHLLKLVAGIKEGKADFKYGRDKWTVKQVFIHLSDEERYYTYKAFCYSRQVNCFLEVPQEKAYSQDFNAINRTLDDVIAEFITIRDAMISLLSNMTEAMMDFKDFPGNETYMARALGLVCCRAQ